MKQPAVLTVFAIHMYEKNGKDENKIMYSLLRFVGILLLLALLADFGFLAPGRPLHTLRGRPLASPHLQHNTAR